MTTPADVALERVSALRAPIPGDAPAGADVTFSEEFERLKAEIDKPTSLSGGVTSWSDVDAIATTLLTTKAKDFRLVVWLVAARTNLRGFGGFVEGVAALKAIVDDHWATMFPDGKRPRARANSLSWMTEQCLAYLEAHDPSADDADALAAADALLVAVDGVLAEKLGDLHPGLSKLRSAIKNKVRALPQPAPPPPTTTSEAGSNGSQSQDAIAASAATAPAASQSLLGAMPIVPTASSDPAEATATVRAAGKTIADVARLLRKADPAQATPYRLQRAGSWVAVNQPPPVENGKTRLPPPPVDTRKKLAAALEGQRWMELLNLAEDASANFLFWFDLHRMVAVAMDNLGALFLAAREVVGRETVAFVDRLPAVATMVFSDGTPFADPATKAWLEAEKAKFGGGGGGGGSRAAAVDDEDAEVKRRFEEARAMVGSGKVSEGLDLAHQLASRGADERARFLARIEVGRLALVSGRAAVARATFEALNREIDAHGLETWEPKLAAAVSAGLLAALQAKVSEVGSEAERAARERLARLDPGSRALDGS